MILHRYSTLSSSRTIVLSLAIAIVDVICLVLLTAGFACHSQTLEAPNTKPDSKAAPINSSPVPPPITSQRPSLPEKEAEQSNPIISEASEQDLGERREDLDEADERLKQPDVEPADVSAWFEKYAAWQQELETLFRRLIAELPSREARELQVLRRLHSDGHFLEVARLRLLRLAGSVDLDLQSQVEELHRRWIVLEQDLVPVARRARTVTDESPQAYKP